MTFTNSSGNASDALTSYRDPRAQAQSLPDSAALLTIVLGYSELIPFPNRVLKIDGFTVPLPPNDLPDWFAETAGLIYQGTSLGDNWDSQGAFVVRLDCAFDAIRLIPEIVTKATPKPYVFATPTGGIQLEWHTKSADVEIELTGDCHLTVLFRDLANNQQEADVWEQHLFEDISRAERAIQRLVVTPSQP